VHDLNEEFGPLLIAPPGYLEVRKVVQTALGFPDRRLPLLIGIDGEDGAGKSSLAAWLSWQLEMPAIYSDVFLVENSETLDWDYVALQKAIEGAQKSGKRRPVIVESIFLLNVLRQIDRQPDFLVFVEKASHKGNLASRLQSYIASSKPRANYILNWSSADHDARVLRSHLATSTSR
jgi:uridine kinase